MMRVNHNNRIFRGDFLKLSDKQKKMLQGAVAPTIVATLIFFITYFFFGMENTMIGPFATLSFLRCRNMCNHYECLIRNFSVYMIMAVLSFLAVLNLPLCIIVNAIALFWIACLLIDEYNPNNYFPAGMALIFFQIAPVHTVSDLGNRLLALLASFGIVFLFAWFLSLNTTVQNRLKALISDGFDVCKELLTQTGCITADSFCSKRNIRTGSGTSQKALHDQSAHQPRNLFCQPCYPAFKRENQLVLPLCPCIPDYKLSDGSRTGG